MLRQREILFFSLLFFFGLLQAATPDAEKQKLLEELTGNRKSKVQSSQPQQNLSARHIAAAEKAKKNRDYVRSLQHFNRAIAQPGSRDELKRAYYGKAHLYRLMQLPEQAKLNEQMAEKINQ